MWLKKRNKNHKLSKTKLVLLFPQLLSQFFHFPSTWSPFLSTSVEHHGWSCSFVVHLLYDVPLNLNGKTHGLLAQPQVQGGPQPWMIKNNFNGFYFCIRSINFYSSLLQTLIMFKLFWFSTIRIRNNRSFQDFLQVHIEIGILSLLGTIQVLRHQRGGWVGWLNDDVWWQGGSLGVAYWWRDQRIYKEKNFGCVSRKKG